ncbi:cell wall binding repeat 2-containing protein [Syntrophobotulus glycolicus DSM 8271]|uniref:Cell wall binding repeat 2-containing protein n=1 Tax=Syntrophobotulus glycolicus (strain DSM 8271 / FlGlyR) TaxID=645991 RepID=F0SZU4_SYNGF|nr:cell wall-binding repeat-containing protein [Syntrophobotulus glycolicus]ADY57265.1 cell wall binding repeat 2-containing protein [Syntrophobotulus glycolicus DSM 8271]
MIRTKKIAVLAIIAMVLMMLPVQVFAADDDTDRIYGKDRVETAIKISEAGWTTADTVILAPSANNNLVDALAVAPLAGQENAPILLTPVDALDASVKAKIVDLKAKKVILVGALTDAVKNEVAGISDVTVEVLKGADRWETTSLVNAKLSSPNGTFVVGYNAIPDALSAASYAAKNKYQIILAGVNGAVPEGQSVAGTSYILGGPTLVGDISGATRIYGQNRYETNNEVAKTLTYDYGKVFVANGVSLVDALSVAPFAAQTNSFVALADNNGVEAADGLAGKITSATKAIALGGPSVVSDTVKNSIFDTEDSGEFTIKSVTAPNLIQLQVTLSNTDYDEDDLTDVDNYDVEAVAKDDKDASNIEVAKAEVEGKTLTLTLIEPVKNESVGTLTVDDIITGEEVAFDNIKFSDHDIPTIKDVKVIGKDTVKFVFSEPISSLKDTSDEFDFDLDGKTYGVKEVVPVKNGFEANVKVYTSFKEGSLKVEVGNGLEDYAGFNIIPQTFDVDVVEDTQAPEVVGYKSAKAKEVTLIFNEDIQLESDEEEDFYHTNSSNEVSSISDDDIDGNELTLDFSENELPDGTAYVYIKSGAVSDLWDNENNSIKVQVQIDVDDVKPVVKKVEYKDSKITVTFSEKVDESTAEDTDNYTLVDEDGDNVGITSADLSTTSKKVDLTLRSTPDDGTYKLTIEDVEDQAGNEIEKVTKDVVVDDTDAPVLKGGKAYYDISGSRYRIYLEFDDKLATSGNYSVTDLYKYEVSTDSGSHFVNLGDEEEDDNIYAKIDLIDNGQTVRITTDYPFVTNAGALTAVNKIQIVGRIADVDGNYTTTAQMPASGGYSIEDKASRTVSILSAVAKSKTTIEVEFDGNLDKYNKSDFIVWKDTDGNDRKQSGETTVYTVEDIEKKSADKILITLDDDTKLPANPEVSGGEIKVGTVGSTKSENSYGVKLQPNLGIDSSTSPYDTSAYDAISVTDEINPSVKKLDNIDRNAEYTGSEKNGTNNKSDDIASVWAEYDSTLDSGNGGSLIHILFDEPVDAGTVGNFVVKRNSDKFVVNNVSTSGNTVTLTVFEGAKTATSKVDKNDTIDIGFIYDAEGNVTSTLKLKVEYPVTNIVAPTVPDALGSNSDVLSGTLLSLTKGKVLFTDNATTSNDTLVFTNLADNVTTITVTGAATTPATATVTGGVASVNIGDNNGSSSVVVTVTLTNAVGDSSTTTLTLKASDGTSNLD